MKPTASCMNPFDALAQQGRDSKRAYEHDWHIWTEQEIDDFTVAWGVPRTVAEMVLNLEQLESAAARHVSLENLGLLADRIEWYGRQRFREGEMFERERYQEQGE